MQSMLALNTVVDIEIYHFFAGNPADPRARSRANFDADGRAFVFDEF
jgi:hypothetical protein